MVNRGLAWIVLLMLIVAAGCATSTMRHVEAVDSSEDTVKFLFNQQTADGQWERGIIECRLDGDELTDCRQLKVDYR